ncbi:MAG TPA: response regulator [Paenibacillus sp.]|uniref:response regulator transcription factor n=1 Tax=Paenibacillus sp. TaxID=58172 RepID=UPI002CCD1F94|nr:response regulator [Paenibacillus sp.]HUC93700.1 response regulator [Paenibacillus sp.]
MKILIADDQTSLHKFLDKMIDWHSLGITEIMHAYNGKEAAELVHSQRPELLVIDIRMPEWDGIEALKSIQNLPGKPKTVILSAYDQFDYAREALRLSVSQYLLKPVDAAQLTESLREMIGAIESESRAAVVREMERAVIAGGYSDECLTVIAEAFSLHGVVCFAAAAVADLDGDRAGLESLVPVRDDCMVFVVREGTGECVMLLGWKRFIEPEEVNQMFDDGLAEHPEFRVTVGLSSVETRIGELPERIRDSRQAAKLSFYLSGGVRLHQTGLFAEGAQLTEVHRLAQAIEDKARLGYPPAALRDSVRDWLTLLADKRVEPDAACESAHQVLSAIHHSWTDFRPAHDATSLSVRELKQRCKSFWELERLCTEELLKLSAGSDGGQPKQPEVIRGVKRFVDTQFQADLSLQTVADRFSIDKYRLSREFKQEFGENYWHYVTRIRMERAAEYLRETCWKNSAIAEKTGYMEESHFSRAFKKYYGVSPKEYRTGLAASGKERND